MRQKPVVLNAERDVMLIPYTVRKPGKFTFLITPGGAYNNCEESESAPVAKYYNKLGFNAFVFRYSVGKHRVWPHPLEDYDLAMEWLGCHAEEYNINPDRIVAMGFSAGGHVIAAAASLAKHKPFAAILCYALINRETLQYCNPSAPDAAEAVNADTCPCFLASSRNDWIVPVTNTTKLMDAFQKYDIDYEAHIYGYALHGFSIGKRIHGNNPVFCSRVGNWVQDSFEWLEELSDGQYISIKESAHYQDAHTDHLSLLTSCRLLEQSPGAMQMMKKDFPAQYLLYKTAQKKIGLFLDSVSLKNLFVFFPVRKKKAEQLEKALNQFSIQKDEK